MRFNSGEGSRRRFLRRAVGFAAGAVAWPRSIEALSDHLAAAAQRSQDEFWRVVRQGFLIPDDRIYLNVGTLGAQPRVVVEAVAEHARRVATTYPPAVDWDALKTRLGSFIDCDPAGLAFPRNTTEGMSFVANGIDWKSGDEILTTDHEHIGGLCCWQLVAKRHGLVLRQLPLPVPPPSADALVDVFRRALSPRTRLVSFSHVNFTNGVTMPAKEIVALCRPRGIIAVVDGAHPPGLMRLSVRAIDPDFYASSPHKWLLAAQGTGFLYMREEWRGRLWPSVASGGWDDVALGAHRFNHLGTLDESRLAGLDAALRFQEAIGIDRIEARVRELRRLLLQRLTAIARVRIVSPLDDALGAGMVSFQAPGVDSLELQRRLAEVANARTRVIGEYGFGWMRLSPHVYNTVDEIQRVVDVIRQVTG
ncbi:MAG: aminotransferase class V-fold PLP-dependent enzyme [Longimicrobiales bacterium]